MEVALSTHHPPFHTRYTREPTKSTMVIWMHDSEHVASPCIVLLLSARARYTLGAQIRIMRTSAEAEMISEALEVSGWMCWTRPDIADAKVARERRTRRMHRRSKQRSRPSTLPCNVIACVVRDIVNYSAATIILSLSPLTYKAGPEGCVIYDGHCHHIYKYKGIATRRSIHIHRRTISP